MNMFNALKIMAVTLIVFIASSIVFGAVFGFKPSEIYELSINKSIKVISVQENQNNNEILVQIDSTIINKNNELQSREDSLHGEMIKIAVEKAELEKKKMEITDLLEKKKNIEEKNLDKLATIYNAMQSNQVVNVLANMDDDLVINIITRMNKQKVGQILEMFPPDKAAYISEKLLEVY